MYGYKHAHVCIATWLGADNPLFDQIFYTNINSFFLAICCAFLLFNYFLKAFLI